MAAELRATLEGALLAPDGSPVQGFRAVVEDVESRMEYLSTETNDRGEYVIEVPVGRGYRIVAAITPDGDRLPVQQTAAMPVDIPESYRLPDVMFLEKDPEPAAAPLTAQPLPRVPASKPWYKSTGRLIGIATGSVAAVAFAASGGGGGGSGDDTNIVSPHTP